MPRRSGALLRSSAQLLTTNVGSAAVIALLVTLLITLPINVLVLLSVTVSGAVVVVSVLECLLLRWPEAVSRLSVRSAIIYSVLIAHLLRRIAAAVVHAVWRTVGIAPISTAS